MYDNDEFEADDFADDSNNNSPEKELSDNIDKSNISNNDNNKSNTNYNNNNTSSSNNLRMETLLVRIEDYLLPLSFSQIKNSDEVEDELNEIKPKKKLNELCYQITLADHIRNMQTMYKDLYDELTLFSELRNDKVIMTTKYLNDKIYEGRIRLRVLIKLCYGEDSLEYLKSELDLANSYAQQGLWLQVNENITNLLTHIIYLQTKNNFIEKIKINKQFSYCIAERLVITYDLLRLHAIKNRGQITVDYVNDLANEFNQLPLLTNDINNLNDFLLDQSKELCLLLKDFILNFKTYQLNYSQLLYPTWGNIITYLRSQCHIMKLWILDVESGILPQNKSTIQLAINLCDLQRRGVANPTQLSNYITTIPNINKLIYNNNFIKKLSNKKMEITLYISSLNGDIIDISNNNVNTYDMNSISYELPITTEEIFSIYLLEIYEYNKLDILKSNILTLSGICSIFISSSSNSNNNSNTIANKIKPKLINHSNHYVDNYRYNNLLDSENSFRESLKLIKELNLENDMISCELYNSIAQLMIMKYKYFNESKKEKCLNLANKWFHDYIDKYILNNENTKLDGKIDNDIGRSDDSNNNEIEIIKEKYNNIINSIRKKYNTMIGKKASAAQNVSSQTIALTNIETHTKAKNILIKEKYKELIANEEINILKLLDVGYKYLIRSYDIVETVYNNNIYHPIIATTCLAIASIKNISKEYNISREWLIKSLRIMEKVNPMSYRAISFIQIQLGYVMLKQNYVDETINILVKSLNFHKNCIRKYFNDINRELGQSQYLISSITKQMNKINSCYDDLYTSIQLSNRLILLYNNKKLYNHSCELSIDIDTIIELAFGWDSVQSAESKKQCGIQYAAISDWNSACKLLKQSYDIYSLLYNSESSHCKEIYELIQFATDKKLDNFLQVSDSVINPIDKSPNEDIEELGTIDDFNYDFNFDNGDGNNFNQDDNKANSNTNSNDIENDIRKDDSNDIIIT